MLKNRFAVFVSGYGRGAIEIIRNYKSGIIIPQLELLLSSDPGSFSLNIAKENGISTDIVIREAFKTNNEFENQILSILQNHKIEFVFLAGWKYILTKTLLDAYNGKVVGIHPSLLPAFPGRNAIDQAINHGVKVTGITTHFVDLSLDGGKIIGQKSVRIDEDDNFNTLDSKIFKAGTKLQVETINSIFKSD